MQEAPVRSSEYLRAQARLYRDIARLISDKSAADSALDRAAEYLEEAQVMERRERAAMEHSPRRREN